MKKNAPNGTVYIVGAGASHAICSFPLLKDFLKDCEINPNQHEELIRYLKERFGNNGGNGFDANIEELLADIDNTLFGLGEVWYGSASHPERLRAQLVRSQLLKVIQKRLSLSNENGKSVKNVRDEYEKVFGKQPDGKTIITFNYDRSLDGCMKLRPFGYILNPSPNYMIAEEIVSSNDFGLLKLHGSINFLVCSNNKCQHNWRILGLRKESDEGQPFCSFCGADLEIAIVPPTMTKSFQRYPLLSLLTRIAREKLASAERIVVWGFSCPLTDHHVAWLLRSCRTTNVHLKRIDVIDPKAKSVLKRFKSLLAPQKTTKCICYKDHGEFIAANSQVDE